MGNGRPGRRRLRTGRERVAALDGTLLQIEACCSIDVELGIGRVHARHDEWCPVPSDHSASGYARRVQITMALREELKHRGVHAVVVLDTHGSEPVLLVP